MACSYTWTDHVASAWPDLHAQGKLRPATYIVWSYMARVTDGADGETFGRCCYLGSAALAEATGLAERTVRRAVDELEAAGQILVEGGRGRGVKQSYTLVGATPTQARKRPGKVAQPGRFSSRKSGPGGPTQQEDGSSEIRPTDGSAQGAQHADQPPVTHAPEQRPPALLETPAPALRLVHPAADAPTPAAGDVAAWDELVPWGRLGLYGPKSEVFKQQIRETLTVHGAVPRFVRLVTEAPPSARKGNYPHNVIWENLPPLAQQAVTEFVAAELRADEPDFDTVEARAAERQERKRREREARYASQQAVAHA